VQRFAILAAALPKKMLAVVLLETAKMRTI
jgi:hypothetical protein